MARGDRAADDRLGDHLAVHASSGAGRDGRARRPGGRRAGAVPARLRDVEDLPQQRQRMQTNKTLGPMRDAVAIVRGVLGGGAFEYEGEAWSASVPALGDDATRRARYRPSTSPRPRRRCRRSPARSRDGCLTPSITTPAFVRYTRENVGSRHRHRLHRRRVDRRRPRRRPRRRARDRRHVPREQGAEHPGAADTLLELAGLEQEEIRPVAEAMERGGRLAAKERGHRRDPRQVQADRRHAGRLHRGDRGVPRRRLHPRHARALGRRSGTSRSGSSARRCCRTSGRMIDERTGSSISPSGWSRRRRSPARRRRPPSRPRRAFSMGLQVQWQQVEDGRANVLGTWPGRAAGPTLMLNGHLDTSYSGREPWLAASPASSRRDSSARAASTASGSRT